MTTPDLNEIQLRVLKALGDAMLAGATGVSDEKLARRLNMSVEEVHRHVKTLIDSGFVATGSTPMPELPEN